MVVVVRPGYQQRVYSVGALREVWDIRAMVPKSDFRGLRPYCTVIAVVMRLTVCHVDTLTHNHLCIEKCVTYVNKSACPALVVLHLPIIALRSLAVFFFGGKRSIISLI